MKELSIEEKATAYERAVKEASIAYKDEDRHLKATLERIFPELKESEDERIKNAAIEFVIQNKSFNYYLGISKDDVVTWINRQGEQKPTAWSEEDDRIILAILQLLEDCESEKGWNCVYYNDREVFFADIENYLQSLKNRIVPQPKQEWSEEDINMIDWLIRCCEKEHEELCNDKYGHQDIVSDLKRDCRKKWDWLESLKNRVAPQKQWKPSDEQMMYLSEAIDVVTRAEKFSIATALKELREQLKKLRKE